MTLYFFQGSRDIVFDPFSQMCLKGIFTSAASPRDARELPQNFWRLCCGSHTPFQVRLLLCLCSPHPPTPAPDKQMPLLSSSISDLLPCSLGPFYRNALLACHVYLLKFSGSFRSYAVCHPRLERFSQSRPHPRGLDQDHSTFHTRALSGGTVDTRGQLLAPLPNAVTGFL